MPSTKSSLKIFQVVSEEGLKAYHEFEADKIASRDSRLFSADYQKAPNFWKVME